MTSRTSSESGVALITVLLLLMLTSAMLAGFTSLAMSDARLRGADRAQTQAFYATHGALEKLTADMGNLFMTNVAPSAAQINSLQAAAPVMPGVAFVDKSGGSGYAITYPVNPDGSPMTTAGTVTTGLFEGMIGIITPYTMAVTGKVTAGPDAGAEVMLRRTMQSVAIPLFQFGVFSNLDLAFHASSNLKMDGRVHTNGNLFLAASTNWQLTLSQKVTAVGEVIRTNIENGYPNAVLYNGVVSMAQSTNTFRNLGAGEGSLVGGLGTAQNEPTWTNLSIGTYNGYIRNGRTGARRLVLPFMQNGAQAIALIKRGQFGDDPLVLQQKYYTMASLRILLSDSVAEITGLPGIGPGAPRPLVGVVGPPGRPEALSLSGANPVGISGRGAGPNGVMNDGDDTVAVQHNVYRSQVNTPQIDGFIKIEMQQPNRTWVDVTDEILNLGINGRNQDPTAGCAVEPDQDAILRLQRVRNFPSTMFPPTVGADINPCGVVAGSPTGFTPAASDYWPMALYDEREGLRRESIQDNHGLNLYLGGVMNYIELDARNLSRWFQGAIGASGPGAIAVTGYTVYFSDRRGNKNAASAETGQYGAEDFVNPPWNGTGAPNGALDPGEDVNQDGVFDTYGQIPSVGGAAGQSLPGAILPLTVDARPWTNLNDPALHAALPGQPAQPAWPDEPDATQANRPTAAEIAQANRTILFRRALKLTNGRLGNITAPLTVVAENPVYVQGDWNADNSNAPNFPNGGVATAIMGDAITILSNSWNDVNSFTQPNYLCFANPCVGTQRTASNTWYRFAALAGNPVPFSYGGGAEESFGGDGGVHNFLRLLEDWTGKNINYMGSMAIFYFSQQATGIFKFGNNVYRSPSVRNYNFDVNFLNPALLPPLTPMFRDINTTGFTQVIEN